MPQYPVLDDRPIDQWKVAELREELKKRKLATGGLKTELIKRLGEALCIERENAAKAEAEVEGEDAESEHAEIDANDSNEAFHTEGENAASAEAETEMEDAEKVDALKDANEELRTEGENAASAEAETEMEDAKKVDAGKDANEALRHEGENAASAEAETEMTDAEKVDARKDANEALRTENENATRAEAETEREDTENEDAGEDGNEARHTEDENAAKAEVETEREDIEKEHAGKDAKDANGALHTESEHAAMAEAQTVREDAKEEHSEKVASDFNEALPAESESASRAETEREVAEKEHSGKDANDSNAAFGTVSENAAVAEAETAREDAEGEHSGEDVNGGLDLECQPVDSSNNASKPIVPSETTEDVTNAGNQVKADDNLVQVAADDGETKEGRPAGSINSSDVQHEATVIATTKQTSVMVSETSVSEVASVGQDVNKFGTGDESGNSNIQLEIEKSKIQLDNKTLKPELEGEDLKPLGGDGLPNPSASDKQVSEVNPTLGSPVMSSISTDFVSNNEKIELKENITADNVKLEIDVVKAEIVEPSSSNVVPDGGDSHPMDVEESQEKASAEVKDDKNATDADLWKKNDTVDVGYSEKLNLDKSSGEESIEDVMDAKQINSKDNIDKAKNINLKNDNSMEEEILVDVVGTDTDQRESHVEKRKLNDSEIVGTTEPLKRHRRWNAESLKGPETGSSNLALTTTPKNASQLISSRRNVPLPDSAVTEDVPKERVVPPSQHPPTNSLRIDRFLRPFTLKAVQELLGKTGSVTSFWMDQIKTHCYVMYSSVEEAVETRNAVYNLQWPPNGGRLLVAEFVDPQEVKMRVNGPSFPATPVTPGAAPSAAPTMQVQPSPRQQLSRQQLPPPPPLPQPPPLSKVPLNKERLAPPPPPPQEKNEPPIVTLDDLFRKTKATPKIYYLPLTDQQVEAKLAERAKNKKQ